MQIVRKCDPPDWTPADSTVSEQRLHDALDGIDQRQQKQHMRTRAWIVVLTAPSWGALIGAALGLQAVGTAAAAIAGTAYVLAMKYSLVFH